MHNKDQTYQYTTSKQQHTLQKRNTLKRFHSNQNGKIIKVQLKPLDKGSIWPYTSPSFSANTTKKILVKPPAEWLQPFQFKFDNKTDPFSIESIKKLSSDNNIKTVHLKFNKPTVRARLNATTNLLFMEKLFQRLNQSITTTKAYTDKISLNLTDYPMFLNSTTIPNNKLNINDYLNCERNLTRLTVYYSSSDKLICHSTPSKTNLTLLRCIDDLLETKLIVKLGQYYYIKLQPLLIYKTKMVCSDDEIDSSSSTETSIESDARTTTASLSSVEYDDESNQSTELLNSPDINQNLENSTPVYFNLNDKENYLKKLNDKDSLNCSLRLKKPTNRKKLVWKLYLILKNQVNFN